ncbi:hypothetical protein HMPREF3227_00897 [Corynebacterium sp. CMW7794]|nr:hypothetical protein HMPREF0307_02327 [Corynebacterium sp. DNF00584]KXI18757.1 hypothetical protein HMPREF3227_00897 [Corynebacterium sp. CMW7794]
MSWAKPSARYNKCSLVNASQSINCRGVVRLFSTNTHSLTSMWIRSRGRRSRV